MQPPPLPRSALRCATHRTLSILVPTSAILRAALGKLKGPAHYSCSAGGGARGLDTSDPDALANVVASGSNWSTAGMSLLNVLRNPQLANLLRIR